MSLESSSSNLEQIPTQELSSVEVTNTGELQEIQQLSQEGLEQKFKDFEIEKEDIFQKMNMLRSELGVAPTHELPVYMQDKEKELIKLKTELQGFEKQPAEDEYLDFEMVEKPQKEKELAEEKLVAKEKLQTFYSEIKSIPFIEYAHMRVTGTRLNGQLFYSTAFGLLQTEQLKRLVTFYESHENIDDGAIELFALEEPALEELIKEDVHQRLLEHTEQKALSESSADMMEAVPDQKLLEYNTSASEVIEE